MEPFFFFLVFRMFCTFKNIGFMIYVEWKSWSMLILKLFKLDNYTVWQYHTMFVKKKSHNDRKCIFHERWQKSKKHFAQKVLVSLEAHHLMPPNTLKYILGKCVINFFQRSWNMHFLFFQDFIHRNCLILSNYVIFYCEAS